MDAGERAAWQVHPHDDPPDPPPEGSPSYFPGILEIPGVDRACPRSSPPKAASRPRSTAHGRATPLSWKTVTKSTLEGKRTGYEHGLIERLHGILRPEIQVTLLADRGFGDQNLYELLATLG